MRHPVDEFILLQAGVVARRQLVEAGLAAPEIRRLLRRRELVVVTQGVYIDHTGPLTWPQRAWCGVLALWPAALCHGSALRGADGPGRRDRFDERAIHVAVDRSRSPSAPIGVVLHHLADLNDKVHWNSSPPRVRVEHAVLDVAAEASDDLGAIAALADAVQARRTTADRLLAALDSRSRIARRVLLAGVLSDIAAGTCSVLEHGYLTRVERPHGLPSADRQVRESSRGVVYRDVEYAVQATLVELDGRLFHDDSLSRDRDLDRDLDAAVEGRVTVRLGWGQVFDRPCATAQRVGRLLQQRGWRGEVRACRDCSSPTQPYLGATG